MKPTFKFLTAVLITFLWFTSNGMKAEAVEAGRASGRFESKGYAIEIMDAYAFYGTPSLGGKGKVILVVVSNQKFVKEAIDLYWDRKNALEKYFKDEKTGLVYFEFSPEGKYRGLSYYFAPGIGCGYCSDPAVESNIRFQGNRITGKLSFPKGSDSNRWFDISLDVTLSDDDHGSLQAGTGGGEPGQAYLAYHRALGGHNPQAIREWMSEERRSAWAKAEAAGQGAAFLAFLRGEHPKEVRVTAAYVKGDKALVLFEGRATAGPVRGEIQLSRENGLWRFDEETLIPIK
jgi:hypothetical protein